MRAAGSTAEVRSVVGDNLRNLGVEALDVVNYRRFAHGLQEVSIARAVGDPAEMQRRGLVRHIGLSNVTAAQVAEALLPADARVALDEIAAAGAAP